VDRQGQSVPLELLKRGNAGAPIPYFAWIVNKLESATGQSGLLGMSNWGTRARAAAPTFIDTGPYWTAGRPEATGGLPGAAAADGGLFRQVG
jgi:hypothetical protein